MRLSAILAALAMMPILASCRLSGNGTTQPPPDPIHYLATQYQTWYTSGARAPMWEGVSAYGQPAEGWYDSNDPVLASRHIASMLDSGINVLSYMYVNKAGDRTMWHADIIDCDQAFRNGVMKARNFPSIKFFISYDLATRAMLVHNAENGLQWGYPGGLDVLPGVRFDDPGMRGPGKAPSYNFNLKDANGRYLYDELLLYDFRNFADAYFPQPNYLRINGACVVFIYNSWRFNNGGVGHVADGFSRALQNLRTAMHDRHGVRLYIVGDFVSYSNRKLAGTYASEGYYEWYDAVNSWNVWDWPYKDAYGNVSLLSTYTGVSFDVQNSFLPVVRTVARRYRSLLPEPARSAYGSPLIKVDYIPFLAFSFRSHDGSMGYWSGVPDLSQVESELDMVKALRARSRLAESDATLVYHVAFNQWNEGQHIERAINDPVVPFPGKYGDRYLKAIGKQQGTE